MGGMDGSCGVGSATAENDTGTNTESNAPKPIKMPISWGEIDKSDIDY